MNKRTIGIVCLSVGVLAVAALGITKGSFVRVAGDELAAALWPMLSIVTAPQQMFADKRELALELKQYQVDYARLVGEVAALRLVNEQNAALRQELNLDKRPEWHLVPARLVYAQRQVGSSHYLVRFEAGHTITVGRPVITAQNVILGKVQRVEGQFAWVSFATDDNSSLSAVSLRTHIKGVARGSGDDQEVMQLITNDNLPAVGEPVVTDTLDPDVPAGLFIGTIKNIQGQVARLNTTAELTPAFTLPYGGQLFIIKSW